jgi:hypothetical protein
MYTRSTGMDQLSISNPPTAEDLRRIAERAPEWHGDALQAERLASGLAYADGLFARLAERASDARYERWIESLT